VVGLSPNDFQMVVIGMTRSVPLLKNKDATVCLSLAAVLNQVLRLARKLFHLGELAGLCTKPSFLTYWIYSCRDSSASFERFLTGFSRFL
jgi:hypothetical protein